MNEEFEKWVRSKYPDAWLHRLAGSTDYMVQSMQYMWETWQASRKQALGEAAHMVEKYDAPRGGATFEDVADAIRALQKE